MTSTGPAPYTGPPSYAGPAQGYPASPYSAVPPQAPTTNGLAIAAFVLGLLGFAILPVILGHIALSQINRSGQGGRAFAIVGLVLGYLAVAVYAVLIVVFAGVIFSALAGR